MGVNKLWDILLTIAVPKHIEDLSGLTLAIDASLWIVKVNTIYENIDDGLKCLFNKILYLKKNNINLIFIFDGNSPQLKRKTLEQRRNKKKQGNQMELRKKAQIQIVKIIQGNPSLEKLEHNNMYVRKSKQIQEMLKNLVKYEKTTDAIDLSEKIVLQGEILTKRYQLYCQMNQNIYKKYGKLQDFNVLDIETKQQLLQTIRVQDLPSYTDMQHIKTKMSQEQKILYEMQIIKKKSKIRELQDKLYHKVLKKKIQNGYEIIEGIYNGKKIIHKKKIKNHQSWDCYYQHKNICNNFYQILSKKNVKNQQRDEEQNENGNRQKQSNFFKNMFERNYNQSKQSTSNNIFQQISKRLSQENLSPKFNQEKNNTSIQKKLNKLTSYQQYYSQQQKQQEQQNSYQNCFSEVQPKPQNSSQSNISQPNDPDNFPNYITNQPLDEMYHSTKNIHFQNILDILGINYIIAPYEAQAQCAVLQQMGLVDGIVTEDSDVFLFGGRNIYRGVFQENIRYYWMQNIQNKLSLTRQKLILFALMLGCDYTQGIKGIGIVNAMQILKIHQDIKSLQKFTNWAKNADILHEQNQNKTDYILDNIINQDQKQFYLLHRKYKNYWYLHPNFPSIYVYNAFYQPAVQRGQQLINQVKQQKNVHEDALRKLMEEKFGMSYQQVEMNMKMLTNRVFQRKIQKSITDYASQGTFAKIVSKRLKKAINVREIYH